MDKGDYDLGLLSKLKSDKQSFTYISRLLGRDRKSITRYLKRNCETIVLYIPKKKSEFKKLLLNNLEHIDKIIDFLKKL
jgi:IS30 family transposase